MSLPFQRLNHDFGNISNLSENEKGFQIKPQRNPSNPAFQGYEIKRSHGLDIPLQSILLTSQEYGWQANPFLSKTGSNHNTSHEQGHPLTDVCLSFPCFLSGPLLSGPLRVTGPSVSWWPR